jgi:hypothetical protein
MHMSEEVTSGRVLTTDVVVAASIGTVFTVLADPCSHPAIDGTGWLREALDPAPLTGIGQVFRMRMYNPDHPDGTYEIANRVVAFDGPRVIAWEPGRDGPDGWRTWGGWFWRYDLAPVDGGTGVTLTYDWSAVPDEHPIEFPPFPVSSLADSLANLARFVERAD